MGNDLKFGRQELVEALARLAMLRQVFHSERDFQLHLAWELKERAHSVRLEFNPKCFDKNAAIDIMVLGDGGVGIELKHRTVEFHHHHEDEEFILKEHGAQDIGRYDFWKDVYRLERMIKAQKACCGYAIFLTNDSSFWLPRAKKWNDISFEIHQDRDVSGNLSFPSFVNNSAQGQRWGPINLEYRYHLDWKDYSTVSENDGGKFRYLMIEVSSSGLV